jgi:hypothetical protein
VVIRVSDANFSNQMVEMREWLDHHRYDPVKFFYNQTDSGIVISVQFPDAQEAEAFAARFDGQEAEQMPLSVKAGPSSQRSARLNQDRSGGELVP